MEFFNIKGRLGNIVFVIKGIINDEVILLVHDVVRNSEENRLFDFCMGKLWFNLKLWEGIKQIKFDELTQ